ncbi:cell division protein FtsK, partial [Frankia sp. CiP3]|uniref:cell division protein FtsK n=1 Tax=Frankia sp. CiP3 TaxID=2880971 RepID=UPI001EF47234
DVVEGPWVPATVDPDHEPVLVDTPGGAADTRPPWEQPTDRRPVVAPWVRDVSQLRRALVWSLQEATHPVRFHGARLPLYTARLAAGAPRGAGRALLATTRWVADAPTTERLAILDIKDSAAYMALTRTQEDRRRRRGRIAAGSVAAVMAAETGLYVAEPGLFGLTVAGGVLALGAVGRRRDRPILTSRLTSSTRVPPLTSDIVERALIHCGLPAEVTKRIREKGLEWVAPIHVDGPGWRAEFDLPYGVTVAEVAEKRDKLASGLRRPLGAVWIEPESEEHPGRMVLWVGRTTFAKSKAPAWPLAEKGSANIFEPLPFGTDQRMRPISVPLIFDSILIGSMPRYGKTMALRVLLLATALDPYTVLYIYELKGTGDLSSPGEQCAHRYASGADTETLDACMAGLREVYAELKTRSDLIRSLPKTACPENKVTPELSRTIGNLQPIVFAIDECQELFGNKDYKDEATQLCVAIMKRGPAMGIILMLATQRPTKDSLPLDISANMGIRLCLRVGGHLENNMILGTGMSARGVQAYQFTRKEKGIAYLAGVDDDPLVVRGAYIDAPAAERIADRARAARIAGGTLTGQAAGEDVAAEEGPDFRLLGDLLVVMAGDAAHLAVLAGALADVSDRYLEAGAPWPVPRLSGALRGAGVEIKKQVWAPGLDGAMANATGVTRAAITAVVSRPSGDL